MAIWERIEEQTTVDLFEVVRELDKVLTKDAVGISPYFGAWGEFGIYCVFKDGTHSEIPGHMINYATWPHDRYEEKILYTPGRFRSKDIDLNDPFIVDHKGLASVKKILEDKRLRVPEEEIIKHTSGGYYKAVEKQNGKKYYPVVQEILAP